jgi:hypothetical protein
MADSAIQPDVQEAAATVVTEVPKTPRELALEQLEQRHQQQMAESNGYELPMDDDDPAPAPQAQPEKVDQLAAQMADPVVTETPDRVRIKVDGVETDVPLDEVVRQYQKHSSADRRLAEATRLLREAEATQARIAQEAQEAQLRAQQNQQQPQQQAAASEAGTDAPETEASGKEFLKALFEGDEENALAALQKVVGGRQQAQAPAPTLDIDQIAQAVTHQVQQKLVVESALTQNQQTYPELYSDPDMEALALTKIQRLREQTGTDFLSALDTVSRDMATKFGWSAHADQGRQADPAPTTSNRTAKLDAKRQIDNVSSVNTKTTSSEVQPENPSDVIAAMKAARAGA